MIESTALDEGMRLRAGPAASWGAILAGAVVAVATSLILLALGSGLGFAAISPWPGQGVSASTFTITGAIWLIVTQWLSAAMGGYLAGRLRHRWLATHVHEVFFRDTAHGLITWAVATLLVALVAAGSLGSLIGGATHSMTSLAASGSHRMAESSFDHGSMMRPAAPMSHEATDVVSPYDVDGLLRASASAGAASTAATSEEVRAEAIHIATHAAAAGDVSPEDRRYLTSLVAAKAGIPSDEAQKRVDTFIAGVKDAQLRLKAAADTARRAASQAAIYTALAMLIGAFIASVSAAIGGHLRDEHS